MTATAISIVSLLVAVSSLGVVIARGHVDRRMQVEQLRGETIQQLTALAVDLLSAVEAMCPACSETSEAACSSLTQVITGLAGIRERIRILKVPAIGSVSSLMLNFRRLRDEVEELAPFVARLHEAARAGFSEDVERTSEMLLERIHGQRFQN